MFDPITIREKTKEQKRKIIHVDMDSFFASVEMRDHPEWRNIPLAVGGSPSRRGVLSTCNYLARKYGVRSAMPSSHALRLCPDLLIVPGRSHAYKEASLQVHKILNQYSDLIEPLSLDEAYIDVTDSKACGGSATLIAHEIRQKIFEQTLLTASAGAAPNKFLAKMASEWNKPNGLFTIAPNEIDTFMAELPLIKLPGIGAKTAHSLHNHGFKTCGDIQRCDLFTLIRRYGKWAHRLYELSFGYDDNAVENHWLRKSLGVEETFEKDLLPEECSIYIDDIYNEMLLRFNRYQKKEPSVMPHKAFVKIKTHDFKLHTYECLLGQINSPEKVPPQDQFQIMLTTLLERYSTPVRLIGLGVRLQYREGPEQLCMEMEA